MSNYKIRVNNEAESREAQELFFELGAKWHDAVDSKSIIDWGLDYPVLVVINEGFLYLTTNLYEKKEELTLPQLRDLVVLHRNDYNDATHVDQDGWKWFISSDNNSYVFGAGNSQGLPRWDESPLDLVDLTPMQKPQKIQEQGLISGADALRAIADGKEVEQWNGNIWWDVEGNYQIDVFRCGKYKFRLKPQTVKLEIEVPAPFEPKVGDIYFIVHPAFKSGYTCNTFVDSEKHREFVKYGTWRTEVEIKIVVEQLRKLKEHSK